MDLPHRRCWAVAGRIAQLRYRQGGMCQWCGRPQRRGGLSNGPCHIPPLATGWCFPHPRAWLGATSGLFSETAVVPADALLCLTWAVAVLQTSSTWWQTLPCRMVFVAQGEVSTAAASRSTLFSKRRYQSACSNFPAATIGICDGSVLSVMRSASWVSCSRVASSELVSIIRVDSGSLCKNNSRRNSYWYFSDASWPSSCRIRWSSRKGCWSPSSLWDRSCCCLLCSDTLRRFRTVLLSSS